MQRYVDVLAEIKTVEGRVAWLLENYPELRDKSYNYLVAKYWSAFHKVDVSPEYINKLTSMTTIDRCKRKLAQKNPQKYGSTNPQHIANKAQKFVAMTEYAVEGKI